MGPARTGRLPPPSLLCLRDDYSYLTTHQVGCQCRKAVVMVLRPSVFDRDVPALDITGSSAAGHSGMLTNCCEGDGAERYPDNDGRPGMVGRGTDRGEQVGASGHVERFAVRSDGKGERLMRDRNGCARRVGGHPDRCHAVRTRVEDIERPSVGCDDDIEGLVAHWDCG